MNLEQVKELEDKYVMRTFGRKDFLAQSAQGMTVRDAEGKEYLDFLAGIGAVSVGHCHPRLSDAISKAASNLMHVGNYYYIQDRAILSCMISNLLSGNVDDIYRTDAQQATWKSFYTNSGAESNECAIKLARLWGTKHKNGAHKIVTLNRSFHGRTMATLSATAQPAKQEYFRPLLDGFVYVEQNDLQALRECFAAMGADMCAIMIECIQGEGGVHPCTAEFADEIKTLCKQYNVLLIVDEVQTGFFRCGASPFCFLDYGLNPDIVSMAKGIGGGFPIGVCSATAEIADVFNPGDHGTTFGGSSLAVAAAKTCIDILVDEKLGLNSDVTGKFLRGRLSQLEGVSNVRGSGLMIGCDIDKNAPDLVDAMQEAGFLINCTGPNSLRFLPPLICSEIDALKLIEALSSILNADAKR